MPPAWSPMAATTRGWESLFFGGSSSLVRAFFLFPAFRGQVHPQGELPVLDAVGDLGVAGHLFQKKLFSRQHRGPGGSGEAMTSWGVQHRTDPRRGGGHSPPPPNPNSAHTAVPSSAQNGKGTTG